MLELLLLPRALCCEGMVSSCECGNIGHHKGAATKHTQQAAHQAAIWAALEYAGRKAAK